MPACRHVCTAGAPATQTHLRPPSGRAPGAAATRTLPATSTCTPARVLLRLRMQLPMARRLVMEQPPPQQASRRSLQRPRTGRPARRAGVGSQTGCRRSRLAHKGSRRSGRACAGACVPRDLPRARRPGVASGGHACQHGCVTQCSHELHQYSIRRQRASLDGGRQHANGAGYLSPLPEGVLPLLAFCLGVQPPGVHCCQGKLIPLACWPSCARHAWLLTFPCTRCHVCACREQQVGTQPQLQHRRAAEHAAPG